MPLTGNTVPTIGMHNTGTPSRHELGGAGPGSHDRFGGARLWLTIAIIWYLILGALYAWQTPKWQAPDEPAHFNYVEYVAQKNDLPVLQLGDYPHLYIEEIKAARFPSSMPIASLRYESHQPPLYYALTAIVYRTMGSLDFEVHFLGLRLFSVLMGAMTLFVLYRLVQDVFPDSKFLALAAAAFAATIPMHLAMTAAINNDTLAELLLALVFWQSLYAIRQGVNRRAALAMGILLGLVLLAKTTAYLVAGGTIIMAVLLSNPSSLTKGGREGWTKAGYLVIILAVALPLALPFYVRNARVYGGLDILAWRRHDSIVVGQLRTSDLIRQIGLMSFVRGFVLTTFHSFWAQFGWMGVLVDERIYMALALLTVMLSAGFVVFLFRVWRRQIHLSCDQGRMLLLLGVAGLLTLLTYLGYNLKFVQHQGRYLFPALGPLALAAALGLRELLQPLTARVLAAVSVLAGMALTFHGTVTGDVPGWGLVLWLAATAFLASIGWLPANRRWLPLGALYIALLALDWVCLVFFVVPALS